MTINFNEIENQTIKPEKVFKKEEKYENTIYSDAYIIGRATATMTLNEKNKHKILSNLVWAIFDDNLKKSSLNASTIKSARSIIENTFNILQSINFNIDEKRAAVIIEGYGNVIEEKNS